MNKQLLHDYAQRLNKAGHGQKGAIIQAALNEFGVSRDTLYRELHKLGWQSGRKQRNDAGRTAMDEDTIAMAGAMLATGARANGKQIMDTTTARSVLVANGHQCLSASSLRRVLKERHLNVASLRTVNAHTPLRSLHPNHVHLLDPSLCVLYYPPGGKGKRQKFADYDDFYKNKPANLDKIKNLRVWRYVLVDHYSGLIKTRYFEAAGESQALNYQFLLWAWEQIGLCQLLYTDKGSANQGQGIINFTQSLKVALITHEAKNARAKGAVEVANNIVEKAFESRILLEPVNSVAELNASVEAWQDAYNANLIPGYNSLHTRHKKARLSVWQQILRPENQQYYRRLPPAEVCSYLLRKESQTRVVKPNLTVTIDHPVAGRSLPYDVGDLKGIYVGLKVQVSPLLVGDSAAILVGIKQPEGLMWHEVQALMMDDAGFRLDAPVIGEAHKAKADSVTDSARKAAERAAYPDMSDDEIKKAKQKKLAPFHGSLNAHSHLKDINQPVAMKPQGEQVEVPEFTKPEEDVVMLDNLNLRKQVSAALHRPLEPAEASHLKALGSVAESELASIVEQVAQGILAAVHPLRAIK
ncbi:hypothetical protein [Agarivorans sp. QJM3NY_25]|uniref:hypothetical protein n=1 Tax=Agarivorans sp. QJM3NY_25 TaxID=3421430 RepID=UPI003D7EA60D